MRDQRASATFCTVSPIFIGIFMRSLSHCGRPQEEVRHFLKPTMMPTKPPISRYHWCVKACERPTVNLVIAGSSPPKSLKTLTKTGTMNAISAIITISAKDSTTAGYIIADLTWRRRESSASSWVATRCSVSSRMPPVSPARTIAT